MATKGTVLVTGGSGHIGFPIVVEALKRGYNVRAVVRSQEKAERIKSAKSIQPHLSGLELMVVPDFFADRAFAEAITGVDYVIHVAAQIIKPWLDCSNPEVVHENWIRPNVDMTLAILRAAQTQPTIKRVILTSSAGAILPALWDDPTLEEIRAKLPATPTTADSKPPRRSELGPFANPSDAYNVSKQLARERVERFIAEDNPHFQIIQIMPSLTFGPMELATDPQEYLVSANVCILAPLLDMQQPFVFPGITCHLNDVVDVHVAALDVEGLDGHQNFAVNWDHEADVQYDDAKDLVRKWFPEAVEKGILPCKGATTTFKCPIDARRTEEMFGIKFKGFEEMVRYGVEGFLDSVRQQQESQNGTA
ncbi:uncharacterized protein HMPREF1541_08109 [Cyphellophora europaea CBS 101466]|uniref:NAD-dependent epimerase/dehydratase domain-containing protein n=1 Tax=Cyphellophora europaea (strain CBS 101466) TaxID=1220924 RepID=W2RN01_CYPE1|nr:uncharacterized protein HMPREF1541_08109 [Cyphellophora europaea CBS 101466]ETN37119.1 hypothetical protein HMPREF1541_08109 [Cyphellophora europaea CBS 101466]